MDIDQAFQAFERFRPQEYALVPSYMICSKCGHTKLEPHGDIHLPTCPECGIVDDQYIVDEPEWRSGADDGGGAGEDQCRVGAPENLDHFSGAWNMGTMIKFGNKKSNSSHRLAVRHMHANVNHKDRSLYYAYLDMDRVASILRLPAVIMHDAKCKYRAFTENVLTRGAVRNGIKANCIFQACREHNSPRSKQEIADAFKIPARDLSRTFEMYSEQNPEQQVHVIGAGDLVNRLFNDITCVPDEERGRTRMKIIHACNSLKTNVKLMGRTPKAVACAVMYVMLTKQGFPISKQEICKICDVSGPTLSKIETIVKGELK
jgi:transcription initiation factor TFIIIB Brf1 subunit/transcription initiation factor TFIIB